MVITPDPGEVVHISPNCSLMTIYDFIVSWMVEVDNVEDPLYWADGTVPCSTRREAFQQAVNMAYDREAVAIIDHTEDTLGVRIPLSEVVIPDNKPEF